MNPVRVFRRRTRMLAVFVFILTIFVKCAAAAPQAMERTIKIVMPDGVELEATLFLPPGPGTFPTILVRTPYGREQHFEEGRFWAENGYAVLLQDARGKFGSGGQYVPFLNEYADGTVTLDWIVDQEWSNGSVGMWGSSYLAFCELVLAAAEHPALRSIIPISGWIHDDGQIRNGGANHIMLSIPWILHEESQTKRSIRNFEMDELFEYLPLIDVFRSIGIESRIWNEEFDFSSLERYSAAKIRIPALHITGWYDFVHDAALSVYEQAASGAAGAQQRLMIGPWIHDQFYTTYTEVGDEDFGPESAMGRDRLMKLSLEWFDRTLKDGGSGVDGWPRARVFVMGANEWKDYDSWPPSSVHDRELFLDSSEGANSSAGDGALTLNEPVSRDFDSYRFDPMNPVPTYGGANMHFFLHLAGVKDQRDIEKRSDVLVYTGAPMEEEIEIAGPVRAVLYISTEGKDTDFTAKLVEVRPSGYARIIQEGIVRASYRRGDGVRELLVPGDVYQLTVELGSTAVTIPKGHRIRLEVSSSNFPKYDRNPNTGEDPLEARVLDPVTQKVFHGGEYPSRVVLPVIDE